MLVAGGTVFVEVVIVVSSILPVIGIAWFAWWFLRAGRRYDERERAAQSDSTEGRPQAGSVGDEVADAQQKTGGASTAPPGY